MNRILRGIVDNRNETSLSAAFRRKRFKLFLELIKPFPRPVSILDVGGEPRFWEVMGLAGNPDYQVVLLNQVCFAVNQPNLRSVVGDAADLGQFTAQEFQAVFSNSVIEHLETCSQQQHMAAEVQRVGERYFVQTPNRHFPLEPHFLLPFFQYYPLRMQVALIQRFNLGWYKKVPDREQATRLIRSHRLLDEQEMRLLFPHGRLYKEKTLGLVKSLIAYGPG
jgi:hypothetical protein